MIICILSMVLRTHTYSLIEHLQPCHWLFVWFWPRVQGQQVVPVPESTPSPWGFPGGIPIINNNDIMDGLQWKVLLKMDDLGTYSYFRKPPYIHR